METNSETAPQSWQEFWALHPDGPEYALADLRTTSATWNDIEDRARASAGNDGGGCCPDGSDYAFAARAVLGADTSAWPADIRVVLAECFEVMS